MKKKVFIGIDVSKKTFDAVVYDVKAAGVQDCQHCRFDNNGDGFASFREWAVSSRGVRRGSVVVGMEARRVSRAAPCSSSGNWHPRGRGW